MQQESLWDSHYFRLASASVVATSVVVVATAEKKDKDNPDAIAATITAAIVAKEAAVVAAT